ncbi:TPA: hypothetical protein J1275_004503 [Escherichia coli]|nr:hypothetical protein [Escherichia coli]HBA8714979.1 hypothetical protein [Escherichia coli]HBA8962507.1 hypothetical protein [Escherichia coli]HBA9056527.1 hypothetical protein [Escherichia coli]
MAITSAFQADDAGSIPATCSKKGILLRCVLLVIDFVNFLLFPMSQGEIIYGISAVFFQQ